MRSYKYQIRRLLWTGVWLAGAAGCQNPADDVATAKVSAPPSNPRPVPTQGRAPAEAPIASAPVKTAAKLPAGAEALKIDVAASKIGFVGSKVSGSHDGGFKSFQGTWGLVPDAPESSVITAEIAMDSTWSDDDRLTGHLKAPDFFDVAKFPSSTFESTEIRKGNSDPKAKDATHTIVGNLNLHGVTKSIQFPAKLAINPKEAHLESSFSLNRKDFGINYPGMANDLIRDEVVIKLSIRAARSS